MFRLSIYHITAYSGGYADINCKNWHKPPPPKQARRATMRHHRFGYKRKQTDAIFLAEEEPERINKTRGPVEPREFLNLVQLFRDLLLDVNCLLLFQACLLGIG